MTTKLINTPAGFVTPEDLASASPINSNGLGRVQSAPTVDRVHEGVSRFVEGSSDVTSIGVARHVHTDAGTAGGSVMATLRTTGANPTVELIPGNPSSRTTVAAAERMGIIERRDGRLVDAQGKEDAVAELTPPPEEPQGGNGNGTPLADNVVQDILHDAGILGLTQSNVDAVQARAIHAVATGGSLAEVGERLAQEVMGLEPARATDWVTGVVEHYQAAADSAMARVGLVGDDLQAFYASFRSRGDAQHIIRQFALASDASALMAAAMQWRTRSER